MGERAPEIPQGLHYTPEYFVGVHCKRLREERGWSQGKLGRKLAPLGFEMHQTTVAKLEAGGRPIRLNEAAAIAEVFGVSLWDLVHGEGPQELVNQHPQAVALRQMSKLESQIDDVSERLNGARMDQTMADARVFSLQQDRDELQQRLAEVRAEYERERKGGDNG
jgi:transcriptional regulator with XRE-family HTH domain